MATKAIAAIGTLIQLGDGEDSEEFTTLAEVKDIDGPKLTAAAIDVTNHSTQGAYDESIPGTLSGGTIDFGMNLIISDTTQNALLTHYNARDRFNARMVLPRDVDGTHENDRTMAFICWVSNMSIQAPVKGVLGRTVSLTLVGGVTLGVTS